VADDLETDAPVEEIDARARRVTLADGRVLGYERLVSTLPLPALLRRVRGLDAPGRPSLAELADRLAWTRVVDVGLGVDRPEIAGGAHWIYVPEEEHPFYRVGFPSNACAAMAPAGRSSLSVELAFRPDEPVPSEDELVATVRRGLERLGLLAAEDRIVHRDIALLDPAYVVFDERRTPAVEEALARLEDADISSIGRFGAWSYSYMERALIDGREEAARIAAAVGA
jgi:protoporphyrinogen oxidase